MNDSFPIIYGFTPYEVNSEEYFQHLQNITDDIDPHASYVLTLTNDEAKTIAAFDAEIQAHYRGAILNAAQQYINLPRKLRRATPLPSLTLLPKSPLGVHYPVRLSSVIERGKGALSMFRVSNTQSAFWTVASLFPNALPILTSWASQQPDAASAFVKQMHESSNKQELFAFRIVRELDATVARINSEIASAA